MIYHILPLEGSAIGGLVDLCWLTYTAQRLKEHLFNQSIVYVAVGALEGQQ